MKSYKVLISLLLSLIFAGKSYVFAGQVDDYLIGINDVLQISVWQEKDMEREVLVLPDGTIKYPLIGQVEAQGSTVSKLTEKITYLLDKDYIINPQVTVKVKEYRSQKIYALGQVKHPGLYYLKGKTTLLEMISTVGGLTEGADNKLLIIRAGATDIKDGKKVDELLDKKETKSVDLNALLVEGDLANNQILQPEDVIFISKREAGVENKIYVMGAVKKPGVYEFKEGITALNACIVAGGFTIVAAPNRTDISRLQQEGKGRKIIRVDLEKVKKGQIDDLNLKQGDRIFVPESYF